MHYHSACQERTCKGNGDKFQSLYLLYLLPKLCQWQNKSFTDEDDSITKSNCTYWELTMEVLVTFMHLLWIDFIYCLYRLWFPGKTECMYFPCCTIWKQDTAISHQGNCNSLLHGFSLFSWLSIQNWMTHQLHEIVTRKLINDASQFLLLPTCPHCPYC